MNGGNPVKIRLMGTEAECVACVAVLREHLHVVEVSPAYPNRGESALVRVYVDTRDNPRKEVTR